MIWDCLGSWVFLVPVNADGQKRCYCHCSCGCLIAQVCMSVMYHCVTDFPSQGRRTVSCRHLGYKHIGCRTDASLLYKWPPFYASKPCFGPLFREHSLLPLYLAQVCWPSLLAPLSLLPRPPPLFVLQFVFRIIHGVKVSLSRIILNVNWHNKEWGQPGDKAKPLCIKLEVVR